MEMGSDGEEDQIRSVADSNHKNKKMKKVFDASNSKDSPSSKPKRQMKTPFQLQTLEQVYAGSSPHPNLISNYLPFCNFDSI